MRRTFRFSRGCQTSMSRANRPEQTRRKATRSRWRGSMFAWILKTKPEKSGVVRGDDRGRWSPAGPAAARSSTNASQEELDAEVGQRAAEEDRRQLARQHRARGRTRSPASSSSSTSSRSRPPPSAPSSASSAGSSSVASVTGARFAPCSVRSKRCTVCAAQIVDAAEIRPVADRPVQRAGLQTRASSRSRPAARAGAGSAGRAC